VPELPRAVHGTRHRRMELPRRVAHVPPPRMATRRRRIVATIGRSLLLRSLQPRLGAGTSAASTHNNREATVGHALSTPTVATTPRNAARSLSCASKPPRMARRLIVGLERRRSMKVTRPRENGTSGINPLRGSLRASSLETPTLMTTTTATRTCT
jgi:hypothetical protein